MARPAWLQARRRDPAADRLATAFFLAALVHGLVILGVRFAAPPFDDRMLPTLNILLVPPGPDEPVENRDAAYLAQRNQQGTGIGDEARRSSLPDAPREPGPVEKMPVDPDLEQTLRTQNRGNAAVLARHAIDAQRWPAGADAVDSPPVFEAQPAPVPPTVGLNAAVADRELYLRGRRASDGTLLADTRESAIASYLEGWKRRVERVGTLNFPNEARRRKLSGNPVLEVGIRATGALDTVIVRRSSGHRELDQAAVGIVRLAAPFDPFSTALRERYPVLRFAYEWQFIDGRLGGDGALFTSDP